MTVLLYFALFYCFVLLCLIVGIFCNPKGSWIKEGSVVGESCSKVTQVSKLTSNSGLLFPFSLCSRLCALCVFSVFSVLKKKKHLYPISNFITVIIACKNEENNIIGLINSLKDQSYPKDYYEVIFADDGSTDSTADIIKQNITGLSNYHYLYVEQTFYPDLQGKKKAISFAVDNILQHHTNPSENSEYNFVAEISDFPYPNVGGILNSEFLILNSKQILAFTDADCLPEKDWLSDINQAFSAGYDFYAGYSPIKSDKKTFLYHLKNLERASIFAVSAGSFGLGIPLTCTARNMAYKASLWQKSEGYAGIGHIRSGDDDLMLHKLRHHIKKYYFSFNPNAIVYTINEHKNLSSQINQETRRTSKFIYYPLYVKLLIIFITIFYLLLLYHLVISFITFDFNVDLIISLSLKLLLEFSLLSIFLLKVKHFKFMKTFILAEILYIPYFIFFGIKGSIGKYKWKN